MFSFPVCGESKHPERRYFKIMTTQNGAFAGPVSESEQWMSSVQSACYRYPQGRQMVSTWNLPSCTEITEMGLGGTRVSRV